MKPKDSKTTLAFYESWLKTGNVCWGNFCISTLGENKKIEPKELNEQEENKITESYRELLSSVKKVPSNVVIDLPDFLPSSFLQAGVQPSNAVCRIAVYLSHKNFEEILQLLKEKYKEIENIIQDLDSRNEINAIFSIPDSISYEIFNTQSKLNFLEAIKILEKPENIEKLVRLNPIPIGTGFLVGATHILTNNHVIYSADMAVRCVAVFNYVEDALRNDLTIEYEFDAPSLIPEDDLDYTLIKLKHTNFKKPAGYEFGWINLIENDENIFPGLESERVRKLREEFPEQKLKYFIDEKGDIPGDRVVIVQHPRGKAKIIVLSDNRVTKLFHNVLQYRADTDYGSSGSPVFNTKWELVALANQIVPKDDTSNLSSQKNNTQHKQKNFHQSGSISFPIEARAGQGIRICRIIEDLKKKSFNNPKLRSFIEDFVVTTEQINNPPLPCGLEFDGVSDYVSLDGVIALASCATDPFYPDANGTIKLWNRSGVEIKTFPHDEVENLKFSHNGKLLASFGLTTGSLKLWKVEDGTLLKTLLESDTDSIMDVSFSPDSQILVSSDFFGTVKLWNVEDGTLLKTIEDYGSTVSFSPNSKTLASANRNGIIKLWRLDDSSLINTLTGNSSDVKNIIFSPDGKILASANQDGTIKFWNIDAPNPFNTIKGHSGSVLSIKFSPDGETLISAGEDYIVNIWSLDGRLISTVKLNDFGNKKFFIKSVYFSPSGKTLASINDGGIVKLWRVKDGTILRSFRHTVPSVNKDSILYSYFADVSFNPKLNQDLNIDDEENFGGSKAITIEAWINPLDGGGTIVSSLPSISQRESQNFRLSVKTRGRNLEKGKGTINFQVPLSNGETAWSVYVDINKFIHVAAVYDGSAIDDKQKIAIYIDGQKQEIYERQSSTSTSTNHNPVFPLIALVGASPEKYDLEQSFNNFFKGFIAEVRQWKVPRTEAQIKENMRRRLKGDEEGLVGYWRLEEGESDRVYNLASNGTALNNRYGIICGTKKWFRASQPPSLDLPFGMKFNEENDYIDCGKSNLDTPDAITVEAWVKHKFGNCLIVSRYSQEEGGYFLSWHNGKICVKLQGKSISESTEIVTKDNAPTDYVWHHVAFTWDKTSQEVSIYIDGRQQNTVMIEGRYKTISFEQQYKNIGLFTGSLDGLTSNLYIGRRETLETYANIAIAQVRLWNLARSQDQIKADMNRRIEYRLLNGDNQGLEGLIGYWRLDNGSQEQKVSSLNCETSQSN